LIRIPDETSVSNYKAAKPKLAGDSNIGADLKSILTKTQEAHDQDDDSHMHFFNQTENTTLEIPFGLLNQIQPAFNEKYGF